MGTVTLFLKQMIMQLTMKSILLIVLATFVLLFFISCKGKQNKDITESVNKNGSIESSIEVKHIDSLYDELITRHTVWVKNAPNKVIVYRDTIPSLGKKEATAENIDGETKKVLVDKAYEIFITIK